MNLKRLFVVFLAVTLFFGAFGAAIGGLFGVGLGGPVSVYGSGYKLETDGAGTAPEPASSSGRGVEVGIGRPGSSPTGARGAAIGAGFGLIGGSILGCLAALVDQVLFVLRGLAQKRGDSTA